MDVIEHIDSERDRLTALVRNKPVGTVVEGVSLYTGHGYWKVSAERVFERRIDFHAEFIDTGADLGDRISAGVVTL